MNKKKYQIISNFRKIIVSFLFIFCLFNVENVLAATEEGIGLRLTLKDISGSVVKQGIVLRASDKDITDSYKVYASIPNFNSDNASTIINEWLKDDSNVEALMMAAGFNVTVSNAKANNYLLLVDAVYKTMKTQYRVTTVDKNGKKCYEWGTKKECKRCKTAGCEYDKNKNGWCDLYKKSCIACGGKNKKTCKKTWSDWMDEEPTLEENQIMETRQVDGIYFEQVAVIDFDRTKIEQATKCGPQSSYKDNLLLADVVGSNDYFDEELSATYWSTYCIEENIFTFPGFKPNVDSGGHFTWTIGQTNQQNINAGLTVQLYGKRSCRAVSDFEKWKKTVESKVSKILSYSFTVPKEAYCPSGYPNLVNANGYGTMCSTSGTVGSSSCWQYVNGECAPGAENTTGSGGQAVSLVSVQYRCPSGTKESSGKCWKTDVSDLKGWIKDTEELIEIPKKMENFGTASSYILETQMDIDFEEPVYEIKPGEDGSQLEPTRIDEKTTTENKVESQKTIKWYKCSLDGVEKSCNSSSKTITWIDRIDKIFEVNYEYTLDPSLYRYVLLPIGKSVHVVPDSYGSLTAGFQNFIDIGFPNYPVHYTTPKGIYDLNIIYSNVGYKNHFEEYIRSEATEFIDEQGNVLYDCEYNVLNGEPFCPDGGCDDSNDDPSTVKIIYRPISLTNPFPGTDGRERTAGYNWRHESTISKYILNNRNSEGYNIYNKQPMYEITLTPTKIKEIREYNKTTTYDDYNLNCVKGYECKSDFIRESSLGFASYFSGCGTGNWNQCDKDDGYTR